MVQLTPGPQVENMQSGHVVKRGTRLVSGLREGLNTRATYTTAQDVSLWPVTFSLAAYLQDRGALKAAGLSNSQVAGGEAGLRLTLKRTGAGSLAELTLDVLDIYLGGQSSGGRLFDAVFGHAIKIFVRPTAKKDSPFVLADMPQMAGISDTEAMLPRVRSSFEGYRLIREYFLMPERFHYARLAGLQQAVSAAENGAVEIMIVLNKAQPEMASIKHTDFQLFTTPLGNLFEKECNIVELSRRTSAHVVHADRTRPRDFEIYRMLKVEDAERKGREAWVAPLYSVEQNRASGPVYTTERRPRRPGEDEIRRGQTRTSYTGDDFFVSVGNVSSESVETDIKRLDIRALCTNRDLPILDDSPVLTLETGDPVGKVVLLQPFRRPRQSLSSSLPTGAGGGGGQIDDLTWRWIGQLSLNHLSLADGTDGAEPLRAMLDLYADRGDPALTRHVKSVVRIRSEPVIERLEIAGPICFGHGTRITLDIDETVLSGSSTLLLSALLSRLFARHAGINSFVRTATHTTQHQEDIAWPKAPGARALI
jgi:type VI secretion system protein ImpG